MPDALKPARMLDTRLSLARNWEVARPPRGWLRAIRDALGLTTRQFADRLGVSQPRVVALEKAEVDDTLTLASLRKASEALGCELVYVLVPREPLVDTIRERAELKAQAQLDRVGHTMRLENQALTNRDQQHQYEKLVDQYLDGGLKRLWDEAS